MENISRCAWNDTHERMSACTEETKCCPMLMGVDPSDGRDEGDQYKYY